MYFISKIAIENITYRVNENKSPSKSEYGQYSWLQLYIDNDYIQIGLHGTVSFTILDPPLVITYIENSTINTLAPESKLWKLLCNSVSQRCRASRVWPNE